jgi:hypothetical protein
LLALGASLALAPAPAGAFQLAGSILGMFDPVQGHYRGGNVIVASALFQSEHTPEDAYRAAMTKLGEMAVAKGFERVAVTKIADCGRVMRGQSSTSLVVCRILAQMVGPAEAAKPRGKNQIVYYRAADLAAGIIRPGGD